VNDWLKNWIHGNPELAKITQKVFNDTVTGKINRYDSTYQYNRQKMENVSGFTPQVVLNITKMEIG
jgi:hypothetical protein